MHFCRTETYQREIQIEQRAQAKCRNHCADTDLPAQLETDDDGNNLSLNTTQAD